MGCGVDDEVMDIKTLEDITQRMSNKMCLKIYKLYIEK